MNDDTDKPLNPVGDAALEARITAWVLGEASPFEAAELEEICARDPEARLFERRLRVLHGFISGDRKVGPDDEWKLPAEKRAKIEALFEAEPVVLGDEDREPEKVGIRFVRKPQAPRQTGRRALLALAACTVISAATWMLFSPAGESSRDVVALQAEANVAAKKATREEQKQSLEELRKAVLVQEDAVEDKRKLLSQIERSESMARTGDQAALGFTTEKSVAEAHAEVVKEKAELEGQLAVLDHATARPQMSYGSGWVMPDEKLAAKIPQVQEETRQFDALRSQGLAENHPAVKAKAAKVEEMEKDLKDSVAQVRKTLEARLELSNEQLANLDSRMKASEADAVKMGVANQNSVDAKNDLETNHRVLEGLKQQLAAEETKMGADGDTALAAADQQKRGAAGGAGGALPSDPYADMAPASPAVAAKPAAPMAVPAQQPAGEMDSLAAVERKAGREQAVDEPYARRVKPALRTEAGTGVSVPEVTAAQPAKGDAVGAIVLNDSAGGASVGLEADGGRADRTNIAGNTGSLGKNVRRETPMNSPEWFGRSSTATPSAEVADLDARFKSEASAADAKVPWVGGFLHEDVGDRFAMSLTGKGAKGPTEFSDLAGMADLAKTTPLGSSFDIQSRFRGERAEVPRQMSLGGMLYYSDSAASGSEYDFGNEVSRGYNLELDVARGGLATDLADGFAANDRASMEEKELNQLVPAEQAPPVDTEPAIVELAKKVAEAKPPVVELVAETLASAEPFSTFSLHVSDASFKMAKAALDRGEVPAADGIRPEEFYNAFDYGDPAPANGEPVVCAVEQSAHPALPQRNLLRIGVKTGSQGRGGSTPLNLTLLLDSSGSMEREDRNAGLANAVQQLSGLLKEGDTVSVIGFARQPRLLVDRLPGNRAQELNAIFAQTPSEGGTNLEEGLKLGEELALRQFNAAAQNRIVLFTDGAANLGDAKPETLQAKVEQMRQNGIAFDAAGFGTDGLNDKLLERLTRNGNGRYYIVDRAEDADVNFAKQLAGAFRPAAENVKVQVRFNPARVAKYKLIGFEEHRLKKEDFRNDAVDAAEMAAEEAGNALYQIEALPQGEGEVGEVSVRFRDVASGQMVERTWTIPYEAQAPAFDQATPSLQLAGLAAFAAEKLRGAPMADAVDFQQLAPVMAKVKARYATSKPVAELESMIGKLK